MTMRVESKGQGVSVFPVLDTSNFPTNFSIETSHVITQAAIIINLPCSGMLIILGANTYISLTKFSDWQPYRHCHQIKSNVIMKKFMSNRLMNYFACWRKIEIRQAEGGGKRPNRSL